MRHRVHGADVGLAARFRRDRDLRALRRALQLRSRCVGDGLAVGHRAGVQAQNAVGVIDGAQRPAGGLEQARIVEDRDAIGDDGQRPRQAATRQVEFDAGVPGMAGRVAHGCSARYRQTCCGVGGHEGDRRLGLGAGHELRVDGRALDGEVAHIGSLRQWHHADVGARVGHHRVAYLGAVGCPRERSAGGRAREIKAQRVADGDGDDRRLVVLVGVVGEAAFDHRHGGGADVLLLLRGQAFVLDQDEGLADVGHGVAEALEELDHPLASNVVLEQVARPLRPFVEVGLDAGLRLLTGVEGLAGGKQRDADALVLRRLGHDDVGPEVGVGVIRGHLHEALAQVDTASGAIQLGDVGEDGVRYAIGNHEARGRTAAFGHVRHHGGLQQFHVAGLDGHQAISRNRRVSR